ncbi:MAG: DUF4198 domain-containing protein, partial [Phycisphaeraceae bacterium]
MKTDRSCFAALLMLLLTSPAFAHDTWVEPHTNLVRVGEVLYVDLMLGNHGNHHRDFKLAGKVDPQHITLERIGPDGQSTDLKPRLCDLGTESNPGHWRAQVQLQTAGLHMVVCLDDKVVHYAPTRSVKSAKTFFLASERLDEVSAEALNFDRVLGHPLELVPRTDPVTPMGPGEPLAVQLLFHGEPLAGTRVSFIPRGVQLQGHFDERYERHTDEQGHATFTPEQANVYLVVAYHEDPEASGEGYTSTKYSAA